jgi:hypothetical protein
MQETILKNGRQYRSHPVEESKKAGKVIERGRRLKEGGVKEREVMEKWKVMEKRDGDKGNRGDVGG